MNDIDMETMLKSLPDLLTIGEVRSFLRIGRTKAYQLVSSNQIRAFQVGKQKRIPKAEVMKYIQREINKAD